MPWTLFLFLSSLILRKSGKAGTHRKCLSQKGNIFRLERLLAVAMRESEWAPAFKNVHDAMNTGGLFQVIEICPLVSAFKNIRSICTSADCVIESLTIINSVPLCFHSLLLLIICILDADKHCGS